MAKRAASATSTPRPPPLPRGVSSNTKLLWPPSSRAFSASDLMLTSASSEEMFQLADFRLDLFTFLQVSLHVGNPWRVRAFHFHLVHLWRIHRWTPRRSLLCFAYNSGTALKSALCGVGLLTDSGTALTGGPSICISVSHSNATQASRFLEKEFAPEQIHNPNQKKPSHHQPHSQTRKDQSQ